MNAYNQKQSLLRLLAATLVLLAMSGCASVPTEMAAEEPALHSIDDVVREDVDYAVDVYDPWERMNRRIYNFNTKFDRYLFLPVVRGYEFILPDIVEDGISNVFSNVREIRNFYNSVLQLKPEPTLTALGRFVINTTVGIAGLWDPATKMGIYEWKEDFGQTLGRYGVGNGPFLVLPILGPTNVRDGIGLGVDSFVRAELIDELDMKNEEEVALSLLNAIDTRHRTAFRYYETGSPFEYELIRLLYGKARELEISK